MEEFRKRVKAEAKYSDRQEACRRAGVSRTVLYSALRKNSIADLTAAEVDLVRELRDILDMRKEVIARIQS